MKIFLLNSDPPFFKKGVALRRNRVWPPITLAIIAQGLEQAGHDIRLVDANATHLKNRKVLREIELFKPDLLIYSSDRHDAWQLPLPSHAYIEEFFLAHEKCKNKAETVLMIGPHSTLFPDTVLSTIPGVDFAIRGEPEQKTLDFVEALQREEPRSAAGVSFRKENGEVTNNPDPGFVEDLDLLPMPAYHLLPMDLYRDNTAPDKKLGVIPTSRGCPMKCIFCSKIMYGSRYRIRSIENVLEEVDLLVRRYGVRSIFFHDQILTFKRKRTEELLHALVERNYDLTWRCQTRIFTLDEDLLELMKKAGCVTVHVGLESTDPKVQSAMQKTDADIDKFKELYALGQKIGVTIAPNMIIGLPNDTRESIMESARFYHDLGFEFLPNVVIPYPDTFLYEIGVKEGKIPDGSWDSIVGAAGLPGNTLTTKDLEDILAQVQMGNKRLQRARMNWKQRLKWLITGPLRRLARVFRSL
ncbi:MAG: B12-binding domain-containing radical SAM protein [Planctomycetota bacterium]